ncbi:MAG: hypothetical protein LIO93_09000 [Bacteroidales bacterium]|nr:hypothetical protein [Bacteroidales bacterium]
MPVVGDTSWVGSPYPGTVYECRATGNWINTGKTPDIPQVNLDNWTQADW